MLHADCRLCYQEIVTAGSRVLTSRARFGHRALAVLLAVFWGYLFYGIIDLLVFLQGPKFHQSFHLETGWGLFFLFMVGAPLVAVAVAPSRFAPTLPQQLLLGAVAVAVAAALSASPKHLLVTVGLAATAGLMAPVSGGLRAILTPPRGWHWGPGVLVLAAAGPWFAYALAATDKARSGFHASKTAGLNHWPVQAALAIALVLVAALAATSTAGRLVAAWCVGVCSAWLGAASWIYPELDASLGRSWGVAALAWGIAFVVLTHLSAGGRWPRRLAASPDGSKPGC